MSSGLTRLMLALVSESKCLRDEEVLQTLPVGTTASFYFSDLGAQLTWGTVSPQVHKHTIFRVFCFQSTTHHACFTLLQAIFQSLQHNWLLNLFLQNKHFVSAKSFLLLMLQQDLLLQTAILVRMI